MLPPAVDVEYYADKKSNPPDPESVREQLQIMLDRLEEYYHKPPVLYSTEDVWETYLKGHFDEYGSEMLLQSRILRQIGAFGSIPTGDG